MPGDASRCAQGIDGVQRVYSYEHAIRHGAAYTVTEETQIDGAPRTGAEPSDGVLHLGGGQHGQDGGIHPADGWNLVAAGQCRLRVRPSTAGPGRRAAMDE